MCLQKTGNPYKLNITYNETELEQDDQLAYHKKLINYSIQINTPIQDIGQIVEKPKAIADKSSLRKGDQSNATKYLQNRYDPSRVSIFRRPQLPGNFKCLVFEGMVLINSIPVSSQKSFGDYAQHFIEKWIVQYWDAGFEEIHILFDNQCTQHGLTNGKDEMGILILSLIIMLHW